MNYSISLTKRTNGGYTVVYDGVTSYPSHIQYHGTEDGIILFSRGLTLLRFYRPAEWTVNGATGFTTVEQVAEALDAVGAVQSSAVTKLTGTVDLASSLYIPAAAGTPVTDEDGVIMYVIKSADISATKAVYPEHGVSPDFAGIEESGTAVEKSLVQSTTLVIAFQTKKGADTRLRIASGATGAVIYTILK
jgi:hypothetical protein